VPGAKGHADVDEEEKGSNDQEESGQYNANSAYGFVLVHAESVSQGGENERACAQPGEVEVHGDVEAKSFLVEDIVENLRIHRSPQ